MNSPTKRSTLSRELLGLNPDPPFVFDTECISDLAVLMQSDIKAKGGKELVDVEFETKNKEYKTNIVTDLATLNEVLNSKLVCKNCGENKARLAVKQQIGIGFSLECVCNCFSGSHHFLTERKGEKKEFLSYTNNLMALLATYYIGSTVSNIRFFLSAMGLPKILNWNNHHYNNCDPINEKILDLTDNLIHAALVSEIKQTMLDKYNVTEFQAKTFLETIQGRQWNKSKKVQGLIISIDVSFDMGW
jgi:hypothetical protein